MAWWDGVLAGTAAGRSTERELLDGERLDPGELRVNLREMAMLNRIPGGIDRSVAAVTRLLPRGSLAAEVSTPTVVDVGTGAGDFVRRLRRRNPARVTVVDLRDEVLRIARRNLRGTDGVTFLRADARALPFPDAAFDVAHASLLLHHFDPAQAVAVLRELRRVARLGVVVNDLRRGRLAFVASAAAVLALSRGRYTRHDGVLSARRAYTLPELDRLAAAAGLSLLRRHGAAWPRVTSVYR